MGDFTWDPNVGQYRDRFGRFVSRTEVRKAIDDALDAEQAHMRELSESLRGGRLGLEEWRTAMRQSIKNLHLFSAAAAKGGWAQLDQSDYGRVGKIIRGEYEYLEKFARGISTGDIDLDGRFLTRVELYQQAGRDTYHEIEKSSARKAGLDTYRNVLGVADHCTGDAESCVEQTRAGWVPIGKLVPIGRRLCGRRCHCEYEYRRSAQARRRARIENE